jgi:glutathione synthase/RimK-type ligase-like ATP-grasp enzyme
MLGFYSVDITITEEGKPYLIEINGSNSGFDGFLVAYKDHSIPDAIISAFQDFVPDQNIYVVKQQLVNFGELPKGYLFKLI